MKGFLIACSAGVIFLIVFAYFALGLNQKPTGTEAISTSAKTEENKKMDKVQGLKVEDLKVGDGREVKDGDLVVINYSGTLTDGTKFDSSYDRNQPFQTRIGVGQVIKGWDLGVVGMKVGGKRKLTIAPELGYGDRAVGPIPANSTLIFEVELVDVK